MNSSIDTSAAEAKAALSIDFTAVTTKPVASEYHDGPTHITHKGKRYKVQGTIISSDVQGSSVKIYIPLRLPGGSFGHPVVWVHHRIEYGMLTKAQQKTFFPLRHFRRTWGKTFKFPKAA